MIDYLYIQQSPVSQVDPGCLKDLSILGVQEDQVLLTLRQFLVVHLVLVVQSTQLHSHITYNQYRTMQT